MTGNKNGKAFRRYAMLGAFVLCLVALGVGMRLTWTAYTGNAYVKGVEVTNATQSLFASDMLVGYYSDPTAEGSTTKLDVRSVVVSTDSDSDTCSFSFKIYNCLLDDKNVVNDKDVPYKLSVASAGVPSTKTWSIAIKDGATSTITGDGTVSYDSVTLPGLTATVKDYTITFPKDALGSASFTVKAAVDTGSTSDIGTKLNCLAAKIVPNEASSVQAASVTGSLVDNTGSNTPSDYDAYNYRITVTGMETKVTLSWNSNVIEIDPYFATNHADVAFGAEGEAKSTATFTMQPGSTIVNFYQVSNVEQSLWDNLGIDVKQAS